MAMGLHTRVVEYAWPWACTLVLQSMHGQGFEQSCCSVGMATVVLYSRYDHGLEQSCCRIGMATGLNSRVVA